MFVWHDEPFKTRPVSVCLSASSSSLLFGRFRRRRVLSFFFFALRPRSVRHPLHLHQGCAPHLFFSFFFFSFVVVARLPARCFLVSCLVSVGFHGGCFLSLVSVVVCALHCMIGLGTSRRGRATRHFPPL